MARVETIVSEAEAAIVSGERPAIAGDSYLEVGWYLEQLALTYDAGFARLTSAQRERWEAFADQTLFNLWHPDEAAWGGVAHPWSGWSICDPGNNYHFHFLRATMLWTLATQDTGLLDFLQAEKFPALADYYASLPGGGSREGTGYGTAQKDLSKTTCSGRTPLARTSRTSVTMPVTRSNTGSTPPSQPAIVSPHWRPIAILDA